MFQLVIRNSSVTFSYCKSTTNNILDTTFISEENTIFLDFSSRMDGTKEFQYS